MSEDEEIVALVNEGLGWAESRVRSTLGGSFAGQCANAFVSVLEYDLKNGALDYATMAEYKVAELSIADVGLNLIDGVVSTIRLKSEGAPRNEQLERIVAGLEQVIDDIMETEPCTVVPKNGRFAQPDDEQA